jgi:hypothetical protein
MLISDLFKKLQKSDGKWIFSTFITVYQSSWLITFPELLATSSTDLKSASNYEFLVLLYIFLNQFFTLNSSCWKVVSLLQANKDSKKENALINMFCCKYKIALFMLLHFPFF